MAFLLKKTPIISNSLPLSLFLVPGNAKEEWLGVVVSLDPSMLNNFVPWENLKKMQQMAAMMHQTSCS